MPPNTLVEDWGRLVNCAEMSDVRFRVEGRVFYGHKMALRIRSPHFAAMLASGMREAQADEIGMHGVC